MVDFPQPEEPTMAMEVCIGTDRSRFVRIG